MMQMKLRWYVIKKLFPLFQKVGIHVTPNHYYEPIPDTRKLGKEIWDQETEMRGIDINVDEQLVFLNTICQKYKEEYDSFGLHNPDGNSEYFVYNGWFGEIDGDILYSLIRQYKPKKILEVGGGYSTLLSLYALKKNEKETGIPGSLTTIEPHPDSFLKNKLPSISTHIEKRVQDVEYSVFESLEENDILFIDSSFS